MPEIHPDLLHEYVRGVCAGLGSAEREAGLVADQLVGGNLAGHDSHGVGMLTYYVDGVLSGGLAVNQHASVVSDGGGVVVLDGNAGFGQVNGYESCEIAIERAREHGVALVGLRNSFHIGRVGHWGEHCARAGLVSIHFANVVGHEPAVAPYGGADPRFGTNPFCIAVPGGDDAPLMLLDMATSKIAMGKARVAHNSGVAVPDDTLLDGQGRVTTDPTAMFDEPMSGALIAFGDHKGSGLAMMCELLGAALIGGVTVAPHHPRDGRIINNMITIAIDPAASGSAEGFRAEAEAFVDYVLQSRPREGFEEIQIPGGPENKARVARAGSVSIDDESFRQLAECAERSGAQGQAVDELLSYR
jgi:uncharacterized oxidoreductase